jgi:uncharacterized Zn-finger protein
LTAHFRTHEGEKPFAGSECGLSFTRENDKKRHEALHAEEKTFVCEDSLTDGSEWGCDLSFLRADKLTSHYRTAAGSRCVRPLQIQQVEETNKLQEKQKSLEEQRDVSDDGTVASEMHPEESRWFGFRLKISFFRARITRSETIAPVLLFTTSLL